MADLNRIGLDQAKTEALIDKLEGLLASYSIYYQNVRGYHWNIQGPTFFELHEKFEELYNDLKLKIDEVAERIVTLGGTPSHSYAQYTKRSSIDESPVVTDGTEAVRGILTGLQALLIEQRTILALSDDADDEGTNALMSDYITEQEKLAWMYSAWLGE